MSEFRRRLMMGKAEEEEEYPVGVIYYNNDSSIIFDGTVYIDTGIKLLSRDYDFDAELSLKERVTSTRSPKGNTYFMSLGKFNAPGATGSISSGISGFFLKSNYSTWVNLCASGTDVKTKNNNAGANVYKYTVKKRGNTYTYYRDAASIGSVTIGGWAYTNDTLIFGGHRNIDGTISNCLSAYQSPYIYSLDFCRITII